MKLGDKVIRRPETFGGGRYEYTGKRKEKYLVEMEGRVIYIHPRNRFHVVEFDLPRNTCVRECFAGI